MKYSLPILTLVSIFLIAACSRVNTDSRDHFNVHYQGSPFRHGIIPMEMTMKGTPSTDQLKENLKFDEVKAVRGQDLFRQNCMECHGAEGLGNGPAVAGGNMRPVNLKELVRKVPQFKLYMSISQWRGQMPGWKNIFSDKEVEDLSHYLRKLAQAE
jgi:cytochrome c1